MKVYLFPVMVSGFIIISILQAVTFANLSLENQKLQKQINDLSQKSDKIQSTLANDLIPKLSTRSTSTNTELLTNTLLSDTNIADLLTLNNVEKALAIDTNNKIKLRPTWTNVDTYEFARASSKVLGQVVTNQSYEVIDKKPDWYLIKLNPQTNSWIQTQFVNETN